MLCYYFVLNIVFWILFLHGEKKYFSSIALILFPYLNIKTMLRKCYCNIVRGPHKFDAAILSKVEITSEQEGQSSLSERVE